MNELNCASLEASRKLVEAGIVLEETDYVWYLNAAGWKLCTRDWATTMVSNIFELIPAPSMAGVWRELPSDYTNIRLIYGLTLEKDGESTVAGYKCWEDCLYAAEYNNPADALIDLLIWVRSQLK